MIEAPGRLVSTETYEGWEAGSSVNTLTLEEHDGRTTLTEVIHYPSSEAREAVLATPIQAGVT